ncbi:MFHAS1 [Branchiostoma lanceolatum]|uniref:MFHAS1 protein n=1 Tax=Branchiostoma lanceolatum TaxID=7740 RepID=A0A8J9ZS28_BRALA|nr:MFHAS1 [Branchiostoma lanceolatum]
MSPSFSHFLVSNGFATKPTRRRNTVEVGETTCFAPGKQTNNTPFWQVDPRVTTMCVVKGYRKQRDRRPTLVPGCRLSVLSYQTSDFPVLTSQLPIVMETGPRVVLLHAAEDEEFVRGVAEGLGLGFYRLPQTDIFCQQVTGTPGDVSRAQLSSTLTLGSVKLVVPVISRHLLDDQSSLTVGLETAVRNNKPRYVIWLDQNQDDFREFGTLVSRQYPTLEAPTRRVQRDRVEETTLGNTVSGMDGIAFGVRNALCRQTGELNWPCLRSFYNTNAFLADNMNLPSVVTRLEQENQLSPTEVRSIMVRGADNGEQGGRLVEMLQKRSRQEPYDWLVRVLREEGQDFLVEEMEEQERAEERYLGIGKQQVAQREHLEHSLAQRQAAMQRYLNESDADMGYAKTPFEAFKCVFLGQTEAGKTSLLNCMMKGQCYMGIETDRTIGVDVISFHDTKNNVKYEMYDFGGHQIYHQTHRFFLTRQALHILNVDLPGYKSEEFQERVGTWLTSVTSHVFNPAILVVGTKVDMFLPDKAEEMIAAACSSIQRDIHVAESKIQTKLKEEIQLCQNAIDAADGGSDLAEAFYGLTRGDILTKKESLEKLLDGRPKRLTNVEVIPVSSKTFQGIEALCNRMAEMVKDERLFPSACQELPISWAKLSENIKTTGQTYLHVKDCQDVGAAAGMKESDVLNALSYLHVTGQILFYNHMSGMEDLVFPDPTIIFKLFKQIFRDDLPTYLDGIAESLSENAKVQFAEDRASFLKMGRASNSFMKNLLGDNIFTFNSLLPLMKHFGLCYSGTEIIIPTKLPDAQPDEMAHCWPEVVSSGEEEISVTIEYSQEPPLGLPETMVSRILSMEQATRRLLTRDTVVVHVGENSEDVMYRHYPTREEIRIRGEPEKAWRQAQMVAKVIEACWDEFPALYFGDSVGGGETTKSLTIQAVRRHVSGHFLRMSEGNWERPLELPIIRTPEDAIGKYFIDNQLYRVSRAVGEEVQLWARLGLELGLNRTVLDNVEGRGGTQAAFQMLKIWRTKTAHGPLHYLPQLEETLQNIGKPDLARAVLGIYKEYRDALPVQEVSPEMTGDTQWSLHLPGEGKFLCKRTDLGVVTPYPLHVTYRSANWSDNWQQEQWTPVGPLFSIQCKDVEGPVDILLPHVLHLVEGEGEKLTPEDLRVVHVVGNSSELLPVTELTPSHAVIRFKKGSKFGVVGRTEKVLRNGLLVAFACVDDSDISRLKVYIVSNAKIIRKCLLFEDTFDTNKFYEPFRVEVSADIWNDSTTSRLKLELLMKTKAGTKEAVAGLTLGRYRDREGYDVEGYSSGYSTSTPPEQDPGPNPDLPQLDSSNIAGHYKKGYDAEGSCSEYSTPTEQDPDLGESVRPQLDSSHNAGPRHHFHFIKEAVASDWKDLGFFLGFESAAINNISHRNHDDKSRCMDLLEEWEKLWKKEATTEALMAALSKAGLQKVLDEQKRKFPELAKKIGTTDVQREPRPSGGTSDSESPILEILAEQLDEENVQQLLQVCPLSRRLKLEMQNSLKTRDLFKAMVKLGHIKKDNLTMLQKDMITAGISWSAVVRKVPGVPIHLRQPMVGKDVIGPEGGEIEIPHFIKLVVPAGALQQNTEVTVTIVDYPGILISRTGVHWSSGYPWSYGNAACPRKMLDEVFFSPAFHVNLHGAKLTGRVPVEVRTWRPSGTADHQCIILRHDDMTGWKNISAEAKPRETEDQLGISLTQCSTIVTIWIPIALGISSAIAAATSSSALAPALGTAAAVTAGVYLVEQMVDRSRQGTLNCWFSAYMNLSNHHHDQVQFHVLCKDGVSQEAYREDFVRCGDNRSQVSLFNGEYVDVHVKDASGKHETIERSVIVDADGCRSQWGQEVQLIVTRKQYIMGKVTIKRNKGTQDVCSLTFEQPRLAPSHQRLQLPDADSSQSDSGLSFEPAERPLQGQDQDALPSSTSGRRDNDDHQGTTWSDQLRRKKKSSHSGAGGRGTEREGDDLNS